jgi:hypothetical protein
MVESYCWIWNLWVLLVNVYENRVEHSCDVDISLDSIISTSYPPTHPQSAVPGSPRRRSITLSVLGQHARLQSRPCDWRGKFTVAAVCLGTIGFSGNRCSYPDKIATPHGDLESSTWPRDRVVQGNSDWLSEAFKLGQVTITPLSGSSGT